jgi:hypothetical protein
MPLADSGAFHLLSFVMELAEIARFIERCINILHIDLTVN